MLRGEEHKGGSPPTLGGMGGDNKPKGVASISPKELKKLSSSHL